jgi:hypothetical protein
MESCDPGDVLCPPAIFDSMDKAKGFAEQCVAEAFDPPGGSCFESKPVAELEWLPIEHSDPESVYADAIVAEGTHEYLTFRISPVDVG